MNRQNQKSKWRTFYTPIRLHEGAAITDTYGRIYMVQRDGSLRLIQDAKAETKH